jgi:hypothetical protein
MASLDFVRDLTDTMESQGIEYIVISLQKMKATKVDVFSRIQNKESSDTFIFVLSELIGILEKENGALLLDSNFQKPDVKINKKPKKKNPPNQGDANNKNEPNTE